MPKNVKECPLEVFEHPFFSKYKEMKEDPLETLKNLRKKSHRAEKTCTKNFWSRAGLESTSFCLADLKKGVTSMPSASRSSVAQFSVSAGQLIKLIKSVSSLVLKREKKSLLCLRFLRKAPTKKLKEDPSETLKFSKKNRNDNFEQSHSAEKSERDPLGFLNIRSVAKYQKELKREPFGDIKIFRKKCHRVEKGGLIVPKNWKPSASE